MSNQEIFEMLSENESRLFYAASRNPENEELKAAHAAARSALVAFAKATGCRVAELAGIKLSDIDWNTRAVHLFGKGKKHRDSFLNAKAEVAIQAYLATRKDDCPYLIASERRPYRQLTTAQIQKIMRKIMGRASASQIQKHVTPHVLRHSMATQALVSGMPVVDISRLLGHEKIDTTMIYAHVNNMDVQAGHRRHIV